MAYVCVGKIYGDSREPIQQEKQKTLIGKRRYSWSALRDIGEKDAKRRGDKDNFRYWDKGFMRDKASMYDFHQSAKRLNYEIQAKTNQSQYWASA